MSAKIKPVFEEIIPPILIKAYRIISNNKYGYFGNYSSWEDALKDSDGYDSDLILEKVRDSLLKVKEGKAVYERDSVLFDKIHYSWPVLAGLLRIASANKNKLSVLDFGGSLGSHYYQYKQFLLDLDELRWSIVEQEKFVLCGQQLFENEQLKFYSDIENCLNHEKPDVILLSSVIQYLQYPYGLLEYLLDCNIKHMLFDRTPFIKGCDDRLTVQRVPPQIYDASYPAWFLNKSKFLDYFKSKYALIAEFDAPDIVNITSNFKGFIFTRR
jgi:putative methyltransferase (TIGR04325 family)